MSARLEELLSSGFFLWEGAAPRAGRDQERGLTFEADRGVSVVLPHSPGSQIKQALAYVGLWGCDHI